MQVIQKAHQQVDPQVNKAIYLVLLLLIIEI
nr:MAG TPA_asm: hypothetical protein [Bacteriophage sp.]